MGQIGVAKVVVTVAAESFVVKTTNLYVDLQHAVALEPNFHSKLSRFKPRSTISIQYDVLIAIFSCTAFSNFFKFFRWLQF